MTRLRKRVAERLLKRKLHFHADHVQRSQHEANHDLRKQYGEAFEKRHGIRLGFMSFYVKAVEALETLSGSERLHRWRRRGVPQLLRRQHGRIHPARPGHPGSA